MQGFHPPPLHFAPGHPRISHHFNGLGFRHPVLAQAGKSFRFLEQDIEPAETLRTAGPAGRDKPPGKFHGQARLQRLGPGARRAAIKSANTVHLRRPHIPAQTRFALDEQDPRPGP